MIPEFFQTSLSSTDPKMRSSLGKSIASLKFRNEVLALEKLTIPIAILHGNEEQLGNLDYLQRLNLPTLWRGKVEVILDAGHLPQWQQAQTFNNLLLDFIDGLQRGN